jgi:polyhydroxybutyrate depolymerase
LAPRIAAIAPVAGPMGTETCKPERPVPVVHFHGTEDAFAPYAGGQGRSSITRTHFYSVDHTIGAWVAANGCQKEPREEALPDTAQDGMHVTKETYAEGREGSEVVLYTIHGGGHTWPGKQPKLKWLGPSTQDISANDLMWEFFKRHARK